jgi:hypothetical protein
MSPEKKKILFVDGDKCIWENDARWQLALQLVRAETGMLAHPTRKAKLYPSELEMGIASAEVADFGPGFTQPELDEDDYTREIVQKYNDIFWRIYFDANLIFLDRPYSHALPKLREAQMNGYHCVVLSSNKETTRKKRTAWLERYGLGEFAPGMILKPEYPGMPDELRYMETRIWKASEVQKNTAGTTHIIYIDDIRANIEAVLGLPWREDQHVLALEGLAELQLQGET